ncbi:unnamed protein product, partial [Dovyalis caffra]
SSYRKRDKIIVSGGREGDKATTSDMWRFDWLLSHEEELRAVMMEFGWSLVASWNDDVV